MKFQNGNASISISEDGTRVTEFEGKLKLDYPRQADVKLTNWCNMDKICTYCHEKSNRKGKHADFEKLSSVISSVGEGVEWAFGGGSTLDYPEIVPLLEVVKNNKQIANVTINQLHIRQQMPLIKYLIENDLVKGIGLSIRNLTSSKKEMKFLADYEHTVVHLISGVNDVNDIDRLNKEYGFTKFLILGYKEFGNGIEYYSNEKKRIDRNKLKWYQEIHRYFGKLVISFDNLGLNQLNIKRWVSDKEWDTFYQGDDKGESGSMYIDGVLQKFSKTSRSPYKERVSFSATNLTEYFKTIHL